MSLITFGLVWLLVAAAIGIVVGKWLDDDDDIDV